ncbi:hypothetical protein NC653_028604 [Populus alba x Populus x berolinensis]|uniref:Uncharacterized protein n=1 Tax=Populus alba x Populus x berolinensis TaxID=444605 RepID=A0AAD6M081_9ROSI|nr:hypothetical protein NC653_028604 [Populus alba x Populus x berolinensis]
MFLQEPVLYVASAALRCLVLFDELRKPDPNREASKKALEHKKEITKHLGRPFIQTNPYEVTPSHKQQSVPSFHDSVLGCWQFHEAELSMEKESLNWSKERLWS